MIQNTFDCEVLTPLFLGGADARGAPPELRAPSIRGAMRYWYRALLGGSALLNSEKPLETLHSQESALFGSTEQGAALATRVRQTSTMPIHLYEKDAAIRTPLGGYKPTGKDYLLWSMASTGGRSGTLNSQPARQYIAPGAKFEILLNAGLSADSLKKGVAALWLLTNLGAVGARANRGAGSLQVNVTDTPILFKVCTSVDQLGSFLRTGIQACINSVGNGSWRELSGSGAPEFDILHPDACEIWVVEETSGGWNTYLDALNGLGSRFQNYRTHLNPLGKSDHDDVLKWMQSTGSGPHLKRPIFGLPIPFQYSNDGVKDVIVHEKGDRRGSPLHIHVTRLSTGKYVGVLTLFKSQFLPTKTDLKLQKSRQTAPAPFNYSVITNFIKTFPVKAQVM